MKSQFFDGEIMLNPYFWTIWTAQKFVPWLHGGTTRIHSFGKKKLSYFRLVEAA